MKKKLLFLVNEDNYFVSHRIKLAVKALEQNYEVAVATKITYKKKIIEDYGIKVFPLKYMNRSSVSLVSNVKSIYEIGKVYKFWKPDIVHHISLKAIFLGTIASFFKFSLLKINTVTGLGHIFSSDLLKYKILRIFLYLFFLIALNLKNTKVIVQNNDDYNFLKIFLGNKKNLYLIKGSGVDVNLFKKFKVYFGFPKVVYIGRMIFSKGIEDFVKIAKIVKRKLPNFVEFILVGDVDLQNPLSISKKQLLKWQSEGSVKWLGKTNDVVNVLKNSTLVCFPSTYREGVPKALIEAASCGRPIVTYNVPGCNEIVVNNVNGYLVKKGNIENMCNAIIKIISDKKIQNKMSIHGRKLVLNEFSENIILDKTLKVYNEY